MSDPTRLFGKSGDEGAAFRAMLRRRLGGVSSHEVGPEPRSRIPPACVGDPDPMGRYHHRDCVTVDRWERACATGNCQYWDPQAEKPDHSRDCPGHRGVRRVIGGRCVVQWVGHCARRTKWGEVQEQTGKHTKPVTGPRLLPGDARKPLPPPTRLLRDPWDREPGEDG